MLEALPCWFLAPIVSVPLGVVMLWLGAEGLVRGASRVAAALGIPQVVIGLTLVAFGTSLPELMVCLVAAFRGTPDFATGNVVGSNIANIGLIAGFAALMSPMALAPSLIRRDIPWAVGAAVAVAVAAFSGVIGRGAGIAMLVLFSVYMARVFRTEKRIAAELKSGDDHLPLPRMILELSIAVVGLGMVLGGAPLLLEGATTVARSFRVSELVIGLTLVAVGTSLPELATAIVAVRHRKTDIVLGNVIGSNIFNVFLVLGTTAAIRPLPVASLAIVRDIPAMLFISFLLMALALSRRHLVRGHGAVLLALYLGYTVWLFVRG
jgi:cation:H+ antiporter